MGRKKFIVLFGIVILSISILGLFFKYGHPISKATNSKIKYSSIKKRKYDIVIYGGGPQAVASALQASNTTNNKKKILMIVPEDKLGSTFTAGAQNLFDLKEFKSSHLPIGLPKDYPLPQGGSMYTFSKDPSIVFSPQKMTEFLTGLVSNRTNITVFYKHDIEKVMSNKAKKKINGVIIYPLKKDKNGFTVYDTLKPLDISAPIFIDASETGKLTFHSGLFKGIIGRQDTNTDKKQMAATLMFKVKGLDLGLINSKNQKDNPFLYYYSDKGSLGILGGYEINRYPIFKQYNELNSNYRLKPYNAGEDGYAGVGNQNVNTEIWMNIMLVYNVDATKMWQDKVINNGYYPKNNNLDPEVARKAAISEIKSPNFISLLRKLPGFQNCQLVIDKNKEPVVGDIMYIRESIHSSNADGSFALTKQDTIGLNDKRFYSRRIGLGFYNFDSNTYKKGESLSEPRTNEPWYVPYDVLASTPTNLLIPGYAANMDSFSWRAMRVYPNLLVLGDAAGTAAGLASMNEFTIKHPTEMQLTLLQKTLIKENAILDK